MKNILTFDVEEHFQVEAFRGVIAPESWGNRQSRLTMNVVKILDILDEHKVKATFFVLGWVADRWPNLVQMIDRAGHELASHGHSHETLTRMNREEFRNDLMQSLAALERATSSPVIGYRAPTFSAQRQKDWIWEILLERNIEYDSSIFPIRHDLYGDPRAPRFPYYMSVGDRKLLEIPPTTCKILGQTLPACGGGSLRLFPFWYTKRAIEEYNKQGYPAMVYIHPWELDPSQPRVAAGLKSRIRHYTNLRTMERKFRRLLSEFEFGSVREVYPKIDGVIQFSSGKGTHNG